MTQYKSWDSKYGHYDAMVKALKKQKNVSEVIFLPNIVSPVATIEDRAKQLSQLLAKKQRSGDIPDSRAHLITHSFAGVDARVAISLFGASAQVRSLSTLSTPHEGLRLV